MCFLKNVWYKQRVYRYGIRLVVSIRYQYIIAEITLLSLHVEDLLLSL